MLGRDAKPSKSTRLQKASGEPVVVLQEEEAIHVTETLLGGQWEKQAQSRGDRDSICTSSSAQGNKQEGEMGQDGEAREEGLHP